MNRQRLEFIAELFLQEMRRQAFALNPHAPKNVRSLNGYPPEHRSALMDSLDRAVKASGKEADATFLDWQSRRNTTA